MRTAFTISLVLTFASFISLLLSFGNSESLKSTCQIASSLSSILFLRMHGWKTCKQTTVAGMIGPAIIFGSLGFVGTFLPMEPGTVHKWGQGIDAALLTAILSAVFFGLSRGVIGLAFAYLAKVVELYARYQKQRRNKKKHGKDKKSGLMDNHSR